MLGQLVMVGGGMSGVDVLIRPVTRDDAESLHQAIMDSYAELNKWFSWCYPEYCLEETSSWLCTQEAAWDEGREYSFVIIDRVSGELVGACGINGVNKPNNFANLGYWVRTSHAGKGVATKAALLAAQYGFAQLGFKRLEIVVAVTNVASSRVATKLGAQFEGTLRNRVSIHGHMHDAHMYSLIPSDLSDCS